MIGPHPDAARSRVRALVAKIDEELSLLPREALPDAARPPRLDNLLVAWADLVAELALGPEPEVRGCPICSHINMRLATRCGYCWTKLLPSGKRNGEGGLT